MISYDASRSARVGHKSAFGTSALFAFAMKAAAVRRQRGALKRLSDHDLQDIGLTRSQVEAEANRAIWDVPSTWRR